MNPPQPSFAQDAIRTGGECAVREVEKFDRLAKLRIAPVWISHVDMVIPGA